MSDDDLRAVKPAFPGSPGPVKVHNRRRFLSTMQGADATGILVREYTDTLVTVTELRSEEYGETERLWMVRAEDGTEFHAWESELLEGGTNVYVLPNGEYAANPEWKGYDT